MTHWSNPSRWRELVAAAERMGTDDERMVTVEQLRAAMAAARAEALEEAARVADGYVVAGTGRDKYVNGNAACIAEDIRALATKNTEAEAADECR